MRVGALGLMGGAAALFAAQAGVLPGVDLGQTSAAASGPAPMVMSAIPAAPGARTPAALAGIARAGTEPDNGLPQDAFVQLQTLAMPAQSGFTSAPEISMALPAVSAGTVADHTRPAAFTLAVDLPLPGARTAETGASGALSPLGLPCGLDVTAETADTAMIALGIAAPCHPEAVVTITHSGMTIAGRTDAVGLMTLDLPALETPAFVTVTLPDGSETDVLVPVPELADFDRVALAWRGDLGVELHVMENGATWMSEGHVHPTAPRDPSAADAGQGFLTLLGDPTVDVPMLAQVYTTPRLDGPSAASLSVDAPVTTSNCAEVAEARVLHVSGDARVELVPLSFTYPTCDAVGDTLVLQNVFRDLRLAAN